MAGGLGRLQPTDYRHVDLYPLRAVMPRTIANAEHVLDLPKQYRPKYDQGIEGACVGFSASWAMSLLNRRYYAAQWLYEEARRRDEWPGEAYAGTSIRAGLDVLREVGHRRIYAGNPRPARILDGIDAFRWAADVDEIRTALAEGAPVLFGIEWFDAFDRPKRRGWDWWLPEPGGPIRGGHAICAYGVSDRRQAVKLVNSWGYGYPPVWVSYELIGRLLTGFEYPGEAAVITDR